MTEVTGGGSVPVPDPTTLTNEAVLKATTALREVLEARIGGLEAKLETFEQNTTRHVDIAIKNTEELLTTKVSANSESITVLRTASEQRLVMMKEFIDVNITERNTSIASLQSLMEEKIAALTKLLDIFKTAVNERFQLGDVQTEKASLAAKEALSAAFAAAKEAVGEQNKSNALSITKSESATTKQIDQLVENLRLSDRNTSDKIDVLVKTSDGKYDDLKERLVAMEARGSVADPVTAAAISKMAESVAALKQTSDRGDGGHVRGQEIGQGAYWLTGLVFLGLSVIIAFLVAFHH
jgi:hypothetical protein